MPKDFSITSSFSRLPGGPHHEGAAPIVGGVLSNSPATFVTTDPMRKRLIHVFLRRRRHDAVVSHWAPRIVAAVARPAKYVSRRSIGPLARMLVKLLRRGAAGGTHQSSPGMSTPHR
jgi:hypothetical protein